MKNGLKSKRALVTGGIRIISDRDSLSECTRVLKDRAPIVHAVYFNPGSPVYRHISRFCRRHRQDPETLIWKDYFVVSGSTQPEVTIETVPRGESGHRIGMSINPVKKKVRYNIADLAKLQNRKAIR